MALIQGGAFHPTWPLPHSCILNLTLWIPPLSRPQVLDSTCLGPSAASPMAPCPASTLVCALGPHQVINHRPPLVVPQITTSPSPPSPRAPLFCLHPNPRWVTPEPCSSPIPQSQTLTTISSESSCPSFTVGILPLVHCPPP